MSEAPIPVIPRYWGSRLRAAFDPRFYYPCKVCWGTGKTAEQVEICPKCSGRGHLPK